MREYGIRAFPTSVFIDSNGYVYKEHIGHVDNEEIDQTLSKMQ
jgi:thioredoxin-related protein